MPDRQQQAKELFLSILALESVDDREDYLRDRCGDPQLRADVLGLLGHQQQLGEFLEETSGPKLATLDLPDESLPNPQIGPYKIREQLGEGGMGIVYLAEQTEPVRRRVALKLIKPGMDSKQVIARFEAERQALAMMSHPGIAKVLDGGMTDQGRPYFVMELVKGIPITEFCQQHKFDTRRRLELFAMVCQAVQHAHMKGIIHRDLKPSNIIVELHDVHPVPKVIDFGIAKATNQRLSEHTVYTQFSQLIGTPLYMSPEQAQESALDVDTRSDIYSLGVLLYELLTGTTPFEKKTLSSVDLTELRRIICEQDPPRPSARASTLKNQCRLTTIEQQPQELHTHTFSVARELDWIVMKAIEKDRTRRYESATALAADIERFLRNEPVTACPPSVTYRCRKFMHRHLAAITTAMAIAATLLIGMGMLAHNRAQQQRSIQQKVNRLAGVRRDAEQSIQAVLTAIDARDLEMASRNLVRAESQLKRDGEQLSDLVATAGQLGGEIDERVNDQKRYERLLQLGENARERMTYSDKAAADKIAIEALNLFGVLDEPDFPKRLDRAYLTEEQKRIAERAVFDTLICLADYRVRWPEWQNDPDSIRKSQEYLDLAESIHEPTRASFWIRSQVYHALKDKKREQEFLSKADDTPPANAWDHYLRGHTAGWNGDRQAALNAYQEALRLDPTHYNSLFFMASRLETEKRFSEAIGYWTACTTLRPTSPAGFAQRSFCLIKMGELNNAEKDYRRAAQLANETTRCRVVHPLYFSSLVEHGYLQQAHSFCSELISKNPEHYFPWNARGEVRLRLGQLDGALDDLNIAISISEDPSVPLGNRGVLHASLGHFDEAISDWQMALDRGDIRARTHTDLALVQAFRGDSEAHQSTCNHFFEVFKRDTDFKSLDDRTLAEWVCRLLPDAIKDYSRVRVMRSLSLNSMGVKKYPHTRFRRTTLGAAQYRAKDLVLARENLQLAIAAEDDSDASLAYPHYFLAMLQCDTGELDAAQVSLARANELAEEERTTMDEAQHWRRRLTLDLLRREAEQLNGASEGSEDDTELSVKEIPSEP